MKEDKSFKNRNMLVLIFEIFLIIVAIGGLTFATSSLFNGTSTIIKFGEYNVDYVGELDVVASSLEPISDSLINLDTKDNVLRLEFSLRGVDTNENPDNLIYDVMLSNLNIDCSLLNKYTKWNLYKNGELLYNGNFSPEFDGNVLTDNVRLTEMQQKLPLSTDEYDKYVLIIWISEACGDLSTCERVDQSNIVNSVMDMKVFIAVASGEPILYERVPNMDATCVNKPELYEGMIPVYYNNGDFKVADKTNSDEYSVWYNYSESKWANAVLVNTDKYDDSEIGTIINQEDISGYYVWIPRFKYKLWNNGVDTTDSYNAYEKGIDIEFESGVNSSGTIKCVGDRCAAKNNEYLTHPAFSNDLRGFWISKYEISNGNKFIPNVESLKNESLDNYKNIMNGLSTSYGLSDNVLSHVVTNLEWGATLYLSHSKYGVCKNNECQNISINNSYISEGDKGDTTTRNVYGVYDMAGGTPEYVVGTTMMGSATNEVRVNEFDTWYNGSYVNNDKDYILRGGIERGLFTTSDIGMFDVSTRSVLIRKEKND